MVLLAEIESDDDGNRLSPSSRQIQDLRTTLGELAAQTDQQLCQGLRNSGRSLTPTEETSSTVDFYGGEASTTCSTSSESSRHPFSSPLGFLQAVLPHIPTTKLRSALSAANTCDGEEVDMWEVVAGILTDESVRELEERGLDGLDEGEDSENVIRNRETSWETVETKKKPRATSQAGRRKNNRGVKVTLVDIRQRQHTRNNMNYPQISPAPDPWTQLSSLSDYIATLLPPHPATFFLSFFHSPKHDTPYHALCSALTSICKTKSTPSDEHNPVLFALLDILLPSYESLDSEQRSRLISDTQLSLSATGGHSDAVLDLIHLLRDLDSDSASGYLEIGVYHLPPQSLATKTKLPVGPPLIQPPPLSKIKSKSPSPSPASQKPSPFQWQAVPQRKSPNNSPHPLAQHIPAYVRDVNGIKVRGSGNGLGKGGKGDVGELSEYRRRMYESMRKRDELLREATKMWQKGTAKTRGGEIALYYADRVSSSYVGSGCLSSEL